MSRKRHGEPVRLTTPLDETTVRSLEVGTRVSISGVLIGARDQAHIRMIAFIEKGEPVPFDPEGAVIYYVGPTPGRADNVVVPTVRGSEGRAVGAAGPTTSSRMDSFVEPLFHLGVKATIGKGPRSEFAKEAMKRHGAIYLAATGGAGALLGARVRKAEIIAYEELGPEALREIVVEDFPATVAVDSTGRDIFEESPKRFRR